MPRPGRDRQLVAFRIARSGLFSIDRIAKEASVSRSEVIRTALKYGLTSAERHLIPRA